MGESKAGGLPTLPFPSPPPFHSIQFSDKPVGRKVRSSEGEVPRLPPTNTTLYLAGKKSDDIFSRLNKWDGQTNGHPTTDLTHSHSILLY